MSVHQYNPTQEDDSSFVRGDFSYLVEGNFCRFLDPRRTPGRIEWCDLNSATFRWRVLGFEDKGKCWELPYEDIFSMQFRKNDAQTLSEYDADECRRSSFRYALDFLIEAHSDVAEQHFNILDAYTREASMWLKQHSTFFQTGEALESLFLKEKGSDLLSNDLELYMQHWNLEEQERITSTTLVLNPNSGEWFKGLGIVLAEMGIYPYRGPLPRTRNIFEGSGAKVLRQSYLLRRLAFVRAMFQVGGISEVVLFRGMKTERKWGERRSRFGSSWTFRKEVAEAFVDFEKDSKFDHSYLVKRTFPVEKLWMTFLETRAMNQQYTESEAFVLIDEKDRAIL